MSDYYDWQHVTKNLTVQPVSEDTTVNTKGRKCQPVDKVDFSYVSIVIPAQVFTVPLSMTGMPVIGGMPQIASQMIGQYNYSAESNFTLLNANDLYLRQYYNNIALCIRYREGNIVKRYILGNPFQQSLWGSVVPNPSLLPYPTYTGQLIKKNFVVEVWLVRMAVAYTTVGLFNSVTLTTGRVYHKQSINDSGNTISPSEIIDRPALVTALPETVPTAVTASGPWLTN